MTTDDRLTNIEAELAEVKRGAVFPSCEWSDSNMRWLVAKVRRLRHIDRLYDDACQAIPFNFAGPEDEVADVIRRLLTDLAAARAEAARLRK